MTRLERCILAKEIGYTYDAETGKIFGVKGKEITGKHIKGYICITGGNYFKGQLLAHHFAWYMIYGNVDFEMLDHINRIKTDNRICNLRIVNTQQNQFNTNAKGHYWNKEKNKWSSSISVNSKSVYLGLFNSEIEARNAYLQAKEKYHIID